MCRKRPALSSDIPLGLSMAMAQNPAAFKVFMQLPPERRESLVMGEDKHAAANIRGMRNFYDHHLYD